MDIKISLDLEISAYRKLLEGEEARLNITPSSASIHQVSVSRSSRTPIRRTPVRLGSKRKRTVLEESEESTLNDYSVQSSAKGIKLIINETFLKSLCFISKKIF